MPQNTEIYVEGLPPQEINKEILFEEIVAMVCPDNPEEQQLLRETFEFADQAFAVSRKPKRKTGEDTIVHSLAMSYMLAASGIRDVEVHQATFLHDVPEDTEVKLVAVRQRFGDTVANLVDTVTKVKSKHLEEVEQGEKGISKQEAERLTIKKIYDALLGDYRAMCIKIADVAHNSYTYWVHKKEGQEKKGKQKTRIALTYYEPLARALGMYGFARIIGANAIKVLEPKNAQLAIELRDAMGDALIPSIARTVDEWMRSPDAPRDEHSVISISTPGIYEVMREKPNQVPLVAEHFIPEIQVVCRDDATALQWYTFLVHHVQRLTAEEKKQNPIGFLADHQALTKTVHISIDGYMQEIAVQIVPQTLQAMPVDLIGSRVLSSEKLQVATERLTSLRRYYQDQSVYGSHTADTAEVFGRGTVSVLSPDNETFTFSDGATVLDYAYWMGERLGNAAVDAFVIRGGVGVHVQLSDRLEEYDEMHIITDPEAVSARASVFSPDRLDWVQTKKARQDILRQLRQLSRGTSQGEETRGLLRHRGVHAIEWLYEMCYGVAPRGIHIVAPPELFKSPHVSMRKFKEQLGLEVRVLPLRREDNEVIFAQWKIDAKNRLIIADAFRVVAYLAELDARAISMTLFISQDEAGIVRRVGRVLHAFGQSMLYFEGGPDNYAETDEASVVRIKLADPDIEDDTLAHIVSQLHQELRHDVKIVISRPNLEA